MIRRLGQRAGSRLLTSDTLRRLTHSCHALPRRVMQRERVVEYFHELDDPYSMLAAQSLAPLVARHRIDLRMHAVPPPSQSALPQRAAWRVWAERDVDRLARHWGIDPRRLANPTSLDTSSSALEASESRRRRLGHYQGAMFYFEGEWYWGLDRLHYLERRLGSAVPLFPVPALRFEPPLSDPAPTIDFYCSLRSPYTYLAIAQLRQLAGHYGARVRLRPLLPMVKRGVPLSRAKRLYIVRDAKREATRLGLRFGDIVDPLGIAVERGLAILNQAIIRDRASLTPGLDFLESFLQGVFADGVDAAEPRSLVHLMSRSGFDSSELEASRIGAVLADASWQEELEANRKDLVARGLWGVPSFQVNDRPALWGQDRLWMLEEDLMRVGDRT